VQDGFRYRAVARGGKESKVVVAIDGPPIELPSLESFAFHGCAKRRLTAYEFSRNTRANARVLSAATRG